MCKIIKTGFLLALMMALACPSVAAVLNFDDINIGDGADLMPSNYMGFSWDTNFGVSSNSYYQTNDWNTINFPSNPNAAFNGYGVPSVFILNATPFLLVGAYFSTWARNDDYFYDNALDYGSSYGLIITGFLNNNQVGSVDIDLYPEFQHYQLINLGLVDRVTFETKENVVNVGYWWLMDNLEIQPVPEPATMLLLGSGLIGVLGLRKKFKK